jgi:hypothetical protein
MEIAVLAALCVVVAFKGRRGRAKHSNGVLELCAHDRNVPRMVTEPLILFIRILMLFVDYDKPYVFERGEDRRTSADGDIHLTCLNASVFVGPFAVRETAMKDGNAVAEAPPEPCKELRRERDLIPTRCTSACLKPAMMDITSVLPLQSPSSKIPEAFMATFRILCCPGLLGHEHGGCR